MARILTLDPEQTRGLRKLLFWANKRQYGGGSPRHLQDHVPRSEHRRARWLALQLPAHAQVLALIPPTARDARHGGKRASWGCSLTGPSYGGRASLDQQSTPKRGVRDHLASVRAGSKDPRFVGLRQEADAGAQYGRGL